jgi:hypothetical protein
LQRSRRTGTYDDEGVAVAVTRSEGEAPEASSNVTPFKAPEAEESKSA